MFLVKLALRGPQAKLGLQVQRELQVLLESQEPLVRLDCLELLDYLEASARKELRVLKGKTIDPLCSFPKIEESCVYVC